MDKTKLKLLLLAACFFHCVCANYRHWSGHNHFHHHHVDWNQHQQPNFGHHVHYEVSPNENRRYQIYFHEPNDDRKYYFHQPHLHNHVNQYENGYEHRGHQYHLHNQHFQGHIHQFGYPHYPHFRPHYFHSYVHPPCRHQHNIDSNGGIHTVNIDSVTKIEEPNVVVIPNTPSVISNKVETTTAYPAVYENVESHTTPRVVPLLHEIESTSAETTTGKKCETHECLETGIDMTTIKPPTADLEVSGLDNQSPSETNSIPDVKKGHTLPYTLWRIGGDD